MGIYNKKKDMNIIQSAKLAWAEKDWPTLSTIFMGVLNVLISVTGFTNGIFSAAFGFVVAFLGIYAMDRTKNNAALAGAVCGFIGTAIGVIYICVIYLSN